MAYTTPRTWVAGEVVTAALLNTHLRDDVSFLANPPACRVYSNAAAQVINPSLTPLFNQERYDTDNMHSTAALTSRITFNTSGLYLVGGCVRIQTGGGGARDLGITLNGTTVIGYNLVATNATGGPTIITTATAYKFAVADYIELNIVQNAGGPLNNEVVPNQAPEFWANWIGLG